MQKKYQRKCIAFSMSILFIGTILISDISKTSAFPHTSDTLDNSSEKIYFSDNGSLNDFPMQKTSTKRTLVNNPCSRLEIIEPDGPESPIRKYFTIKKIIWTFDDYWIHFNHCPPHPGFDGLSQRINNFGGHVNIMCPFIPPWISEALGNVIQNYSVVDDFAPFHSGFSQDHVDLSLAFFNRPLIYPQCHGWNHSANLGYANLSFAHELINYTLWNWYNNYNIKPNFFLGHGYDGNYNISLALKHFSETYWNVHAEDFRTDWESRFPNGIPPAVEYIGDSCDPYFGCDFGTPCETLAEAKLLFNDYSQDKEILFIRGHPSFLHLSYHQTHLILWQDWIDWIYQEHELININHTQAIEYKIDRQNFSVVKNDEFNFTINLSNCLFNHNVLFSNPYNDSFQWILHDESGNYIGLVQDDVFLLLEKGKIYYLTQKNYVVTVNLSSGWNLISLPVNQSFHKENIAVNYLGVNYTWDQAVENGTVLGFVYSWDTGIQNYNFAEILNPDEGYWLYANDACDLWISSNITCYDEYITDLSVNWNLIGLPNDLSVDIINLTIFYDEMYYTWDQAVDNNIILPFIYQWNANIQNFEFTDRLVPGKGYWIYAKEYCILFC